MPAERRPASSHLALRPSGTVKGSAFQPIADLAAAISSAPSGAPWLPAVPAFFGAEKPMMVRQAMMVGFFERIAWLSAPARSCPSWPFTRRTAQP